MESAIGASVQPAGLPGPGVGAAYGHAWRHLWRNFWVLLGVSIVAFLLSIPGSILQSIFTGDGTDAGRALIGSLVFLIYAILVEIPVAVGLFYAYLRAARGESPQFGDLFAAFQRAYGSSIGAMILYYILVVIGTILLVIPGIIVAVKLSFVPFLVIAEGKGAVDAIKESWNRTTGYSWTLFLAWLLAIPIAFVGALILIVGLIPAYMWILLAYATLYASITAVKTGRAA